MIPRVTNGPSISVTETTTNKINRRTLDFDKDTVEYVQFRIAMPKSWDEGTVTFQPVWTHGSTTTNFKVSWGFRPSRSRMGKTATRRSERRSTATTPADRQGSSTSDPESAAITVAGTPASEDSVTFQVLRKADDATNDTLAIDASLIGIRLYINTDAGSDA
jgi:hypothetical protein